jgi:hypothetical protein
MRRTISTQHPELLPLPNGPQIKRRRAFDRMNAVIVGGAS